MNNLNEILECVVSQLGESRMTMLQDALARHSQTDEYPAVNAAVTALIMKGTADLVLHGEHSLVACSPDGTSAEYDIPTAADAIGEIATSKNATRALLSGKMSLARAIQAHRDRAEQAEAQICKEDIQTKGTVATESIFEDEPSGIHVVHLSLVPHLLYEGFVLKHCLRNPEMAQRYLDDDNVVVYSLRLNGKTPVTTVEVRPETGTIPQARGKGDVPIKIMSEEHRVLIASIPTIAEHCRSPHSTLKITDRIRNL